MSRYVYRYVYRYVHRGYAYSYAYRGLQVWPQAFASAATRRTPNGFTSCFWFCRR